MESGLRGKTALITGGASGIGLGIAKALAAEGVRLAIASRAPDPTALDTLRQTGVEVVAIPTDVRDAEQVARMVRTAIDALGHLDLYINNAAWVWHQPVTRIDRAAWQNTIDTNLSACVWACRDVARQMIPRGRGAILIIGSTAMFTVQYEELAYRVSKTGLRVVMENLAIELAPYGIRVNMIVPGHFETRMTAGVDGMTLKTLVGQIPLQRTGKTDEIGPTAVLLLSDKLSGYTTGTYVMIDGGLHLHPLPLRTREQILALNRDAPDRPNKEPDPPPSAVITKEGESS